MLQKLLAFNQTLNTQISLWREHASFLDKLSTQIKLFHIPEIQDLLVPSLFQHIYSGNITIR